MARSCLRLLLTTGIVVAFIGGVHGQDFQSTITFENRSGEVAKVRLIGPSFQEVEVPDQSSRTVPAAPGEYYLLVRYGKTDFHYSRGEGFAVEEDATTYSKLSITLHPVIGGDYETRESSQAEFEAAYRTEGGDSKPEPSRGSRWIVSELKIHLQDLFEQASSCVNSLTEENAFVVVEGLFKNVAGLSENRVEAGQVLLLTNSEGSNGVWGKGEWESVGLLRSGVSTHSSDDFLCFRKSTVSAGDSSSSAIPSDSEAEVELRLPAGEVALAFVFIVPKGAFGDLRLSVEGTLFDLPAPRGTSPGTVRFEPN